MGDDTKKYSYVNKYLRKGGHPTKWTDDATRITQNCMIEAQDKKWCLWVVVIE